MELGWFYSPRQIARYFPSRFTSLKPPRQKLGNPWTIIKQLDKHQWSMFLCGWLSWAWDAFDFFTVSLTRKYYKHLHQRSTASDVKSAQ
jgi:SHS family lactate transporter-like MFS transporter